MKIMQIGVGRWGANHLRVLSNLPVDLYVAEISASGRQYCLDQGIAHDHISEDYREFTDIVTAVDVVTPASTHFSICAELLEKGKAVFVEKPLAPTGVQAEKLSALALQRNILLQVGHIFRYDPAADFIKDYIRSGHMGAVQSLSGVFSGFKRPRTDGGVAISDGLHFIDLFNYLMEGLPRKVTARCEDLLRRGMDDMTWIWLDYSGIPAVVEANYFSPDKKRLFTVTGEQATLVCDFSSSQDKVRIYRNRHVLDNDTWKSVSGEIINKEILPAEPLFLELQDFVGCVKSGSRPKAGGRAGVDAVRIVEAALQSSTEGREILIA